MQASLTGLPPAASTQISKERFILFDKHLKTTEAGGLNWSWFLIVHVNKIVVNLESMVVQSMGQP